jgi:hypothetical protein
VCVLLAAAFDVLAGLYVRLAQFMAFEREPCLVPAFRSRIKFALPHSDAMKNLAGFHRGFRFTGQKHVCAAAKKEPSHGPENRKTKTPTKNL